MAKEFDISMVLASTERMGAKIVRGAGVDDPMGSHLLGMPYAEKSDEFPPSQGQAGWKLLAQINFEALRGMLPSPFPEAGILQLFVDEKSCLGIDFEKMNVNGWGHYARFVKDPNVEKWDGSLASALRWPDAGLPYGPYGACVPLERPVGLAFEPMEQELLPTDEPGKSEHAEELKAIKEAGEEVEALWWDREPGPHSQVGAYAYFTQWDPRDASEPWEVLLQIDTDGELGTMWGDSGVGNVSIRRSDLERGDFSRLFFAWDCC